MGHMPELEIKYKTYTGQLNWLFGFCSLPPILSASLVYSKKPCSSDSLYHKRRLFYFLCKYVLRLKPENIIILQSEQLAKSWYKKLRDDALDEMAKLEEAINESFKKHFMDFDNLPKVDFDIVPSETEGVYYLKSNESSM